MAKARGMTLIEVGIAMAVAAIMVGLAIPAMSNVTRAQLRQKTGQLAGGVRALYGAAAIGGRTCRLTFDLDANAYWSECAKTNVRLDREGERSQNGARVANRDEELAAEPSREGMSAEDREKLELLRKSAFSPSAVIPKTELGSTVKIVDIWVQHQPERYSSGKAYLYFWSSGLTESASIHLAQGEDVYSILVSPLTGRARVLGQRIDAPEQRQ